MTLGEGTTLNILARNTDMMALGAESTESKHLSSGPINVLALVDGLLAVGEDTLEVAVDIEAFGKLADRIAECLQLVASDGGGQMGEDLSSELLGGLEAVPGGREPLTAGRLVVFAAVEAVVEHAPHPFLVLLDVLFRERALLEEVVNVPVELSSLLGNALVHQWLSERGLVSLVVTELAVADDIDDNVALELGTPVSSKLANEVDGLDIITVDVEDGSVNGLGDIRAVRSRTSEARISGETNLVVHNDVDGTASLVGRQRVEAHGLVDDTLRSKSSITVKQHTHGRAEVLLIVVIMLDGASFTKYHGILSFQMGRVSDERELHTLAGGSRSLEVHAKMVLDITGSLIGGLDGTAELAEDGLVGFPDDIGEHVETATMGHTDDDIFDTIVDAAIDQSLHTRHKGFATLETKALVVGELGSKEVLEAGTPDQPVENTTLLIDRVLVRIGDLDAVTDPIARLTVGNVDVLNTVGTAVDLFASSNDLTEGHLFPGFGLKTGEDTGAKVEFLVEIPLREAIVLKFELSRLVVSERFLLSANSERIGLGLVVAAGLVCADEELDLQMVGDVGSSDGASLGHMLGDTTGGSGDDRRRGLEGLRDGHTALFHVVEVGAP